MPPLNLPHGPAATINGASGRPAGACTRLPCPRMPPRSTSRPGRLLAGALVCLAAAAPAAGAQGSPGARPESTPAAARHFPSDAEAVTPELARQTFEAAWSRIGSTYYDTTMRGLDWAGVRRELLPRAEAARTQGALRVVLRDMASRMGESHFGVIPRDASRLAEAGTAAPGTDSRAGDVGATLRYVDGQVVVAAVAPGRPAAAAGVRPGWAVETVDGDSVAVALRDFARLTDVAERREARLRLPLGIETRLGGPAGTPVTVTFRDGAGRSVRHVLQRAPTPGTMVRFGNLPPTPAQVNAERRMLPDGGCVGVLRWNTWMLPLVAEIQRGVDSLRACRGMVLDLRGNLGGVAGMVMVVGGQFLDEPKPLGVFRTRGGELRFLANPRRVNADGSAATPYAGPLAMLIDEQSASTSEFFAAGLQQTGRARLFGETTAGMALPAGLWKLPNGDVLLHVVADFTAPDGTRIEARGVSPDVRVPLDRQTLLAGRDAPLEAAVAWILQAPSARQ